MDRRGQGAWDVNKSTRIPVASLKLTREEANTAWKALKQYARWCNDDELQHVNYMLASLQHQANFKRSGTPY